MDIVTCVINRIGFIEKLVKSLDETLSKPRKLTILDNGSDKDVKGYAEKIGAGYIRNETNKGIYKAYDQAYRATKEKYLAMVHNDIYIFEKNWDKRVLDIIEEVEKKYGKKVGIVGFAGSAGGNKDASRAGFMSNLISFEGSQEAEVHGLRITDHHPAVFLDGSVMICSREMLDKIGGIDTGYKCHHIYDYEMSLASINAGFVNVVVGVKFAHRGGITAISYEAQESFNEWCKDDKELSDYFQQGQTFNPRLMPEQAIMDFNINRFFRKWQNFLPCYMDEQFNLIKGRSY